MGFLLSCVALILCGVAVFSSQITLTLNSDYAKWTLENKNGSIKIPGSVPGGVYSDLQKAGVIGDILFGYNDVTARWVALDTWTYTGLFNLSISKQSKVAHLVLHGVDTVGYIELNGIPVGSTDNMFIRYVFDVKQYLKEGLNELKVSFASPVEAARILSDKHYTAPACVPPQYNGECHVNQLRKMQASFAWDWGPAFPSVGLWKPATMELFDGVIIRDLTTHIKKNGDHWEVNIKAHLEAAQKIQKLIGQLEASLVDDAQATVTVMKSVDIDIGADGTGIAEIDMRISDNVISLWWPNGYGDQPLYDLTVTVTTYHNPGEKSSKSIKLGFRTLEVVEKDAAAIFGNNSYAGKGLTFYFQINGYPLFMKGSNWIPANILPELSSQHDTVENLLTAARNAHMSMLRVWGGGVYESDYFYETCDRLGILVWQDFMFACSMYPVDADYLASVLTEVEQNVLRLQHHPSIAIWAGNNENEAALSGNWYGTNKELPRYKSEYVKLYVETIKPVVEELDPGRRYVVSSPSNGLKSEQDGYVSKNPYDPHYGDSHYYNNFADLWNPNTYPKTRFASEYGFQGMPSLATMRTATQNQSDFSVDSEYSKHRQHSPMGYSYIESQMDKHIKLDENDPDYFEKYVFYSQIVQAMAMKTESEFYRQSQEDWYTMGALYWQLNDVWQAPTWSGIEFGGKWKMLHYYVKSFFAPVLVSPQVTNLGDVNVYLINDRLVPIIDAEIRIETFNWTSFVPVHIQKYTVSTEPLTATKVISKAQNQIWHDRANEIFVRFTLKAKGVQSSPYNFLFPVPLKNIQGLRKPQVKITVNGQRPIVDQFSYSVDIRVDTVVLFLWLDTDVEGHFEDNGFIVAQPYVRVEFLTTENIEPQKLEKSITYKYYLN